MTSTTALERGKRFRRLILGLVAVGVLALLGATVIDQAPVGVAVYVLAVAGALGATVYGQLSDGVTLGDERSQRLERQASDLTFKLFGYLGLFAFVGVMILDTIGAYTVSSTVETLWTAYGVIAITWGVIYTVLRYRG